jgi:two-component system phosphate regulon response regulator PhoB/two-component system alkaline phosphatase synthesis response regulator PhoP
VESAAQRTIANWQHPIIIVAGLGVIVSMASPELQLVAVVDDEPDIVELVSIHLKRAGFEVRGFPDGKTFLRFIEKRVPALVVLDLMLPDMDGLEICRHLRAEDRYSSVPIIMLTARGEEADKVLGLELGADDYVAKPFSARELAARVKAILRRKTGERKTRRITVGNILVIDTERYEVTVSGRKVALTPTEFRILAFLSASQGLVFSRDQILDHLWGREKAVVDRTIDVHIKHLRDKLGKAAGFIKNIRGVGYKIEK